ncbi:HNH endonuclease family protein [Aliiruegeria lutimaris]|nr:HNH endonuclease family protein [Aliiruegeria lutimaris]
MDNFTDTFFVLQTGDLADSIPEDLGKALRDLHDMGAPSSVFPFFLKLVDAVNADEVAEEMATESARLVESFLFRRAISGFEPTGLHAVFKGLWGEASEHGFSVEMVKTAISRRSTVPWPNDTEFEKAVLEGSLYGKRVAKYARRQFELSADGESPIDDFQIEHILPVKPGPDWVIKDEEEAASLKHSWGNLIPLTSSMNPALSNSGFDAKAAEYRGSIFASARSIATDHTNWSTDSIRRRSKLIAAWAKTRWPHSRA